MTRYPMPANNVHYWKLRAMGVRANAAHFVAGIVAKFTNPPSESDYVWLAANAKNMSYTPLSYLPRAERVHYSFAGRNV